MIQVKRKKSIFETIKAALKRDMEQQKEPNTIVNNQYKHHNGD